MAHLDHLGFFLLLLLAHFFSFLINDGHPSWENGNLFIKIRFKSKSWLIKKMLRSKNIIIGQHLWTFFPCSWFTFRGFWPLSLLFEFFVVLFIYHLYLSVSLPPPRHLQNLFRFLIQNKQKTVWVSQWPFDHNAIWIWISFSFLFCPKSIFGLLASLIDIRERF